METKGKSLLKRCISAIFYGVGGAVGSRVLILLANVLLSRMLGQEVYGQYSSISSTVNLFVTFSGVGISATLTRYVAAYREDNERLGIYIRTLSSICFGMSLLLSCVLFIFSKQISILSTGGAELAVYFRIVAITVFFASMSAVEHSILVGFELFRTSSVVQIIRCFLFCVLGYGMSKLWGIYGAVYALLISHGIQYVISIAVNQKNYRARAVKMVWQWNWELREVTFGYAIPAFVSGLFVMPVHWIGNSMLTRTAGFAQMALFSVANQWMQYITYIPAQMGQMRPIYTDLFVKGQKRTLRKLMLKISTVTTAAAAGIGVVVCFVSRWILAVYGDSYVSGQSVFILMVIAAVLYTAQVQTGFMLQAMNKMWISVGINGIWGISLIAVFAGLLSRGAMGYAAAYCAAYLISLVIQLALMYLYLRKAEDRDCV